ncbi:MAG: hypothetical protein ACPG52_08080 [Cognaticolwellia sp.]
MSKHLPGDTKFTAQVKVLLNKIYRRSPLKDSVLDRAIAYYQHNHVLGGDADENSAVERNERAQHLQQICREIIDLCEGKTFAETKRKSAELLGTIQLLAPSEGNKVASVNEQSKPLYKGVLALRLLDEICDKQLLPNSYLAQELAEIADFNYKELFSECEVAYRQFVDRVKVPVLMAAILQDIGNNHPDAEKIMFGEDGKQDNFRTLKIEERKALLQINYRETVKYLINGIGVPIYTGNLKSERDSFNQVEAKKLRFVQQLLKSSVQPKLGIGNLLKVPQIYTSIVLSTKESYNYKLLPKVYQALHQNAERGRCSRAIVDSLYKITGDFPQGFGVVYIPHDVDQEVRYEYAIVTQLYPDNPSEPHCRMATRHLTFVGYGHDLVVSKTHNLYSNETAKQFSNISKGRLNEILELLSSNYLERKELDLLPRCWQPGEYFSIKANQKLWNRAR